MPLPGNKKRKIKNLIYGDKNYWLIKAEVTDPPKRLLKDWTDVQDTQMWRWLVNKRHIMCKEQLGKGNAIKMTSKGASLAPLLNSGDTFIIRPISKDDIIRVGDIVFAAVQPGSRMYIHLVWSIREEVDKKVDVLRQVYRIGNNKIGAEQKLNGWCWREHIHGYVPKECIRIEKPSK